MNELKYSVNGKYFKDYKVLISSSEGIGDGLKRKSVNTYDWAEYHGIAPDLSNPKFEPREITLKGFVIGSHWDEMMENFNTILYEFQKSGTQRLLIEPFNMKPRPYEVFMEDSAPLQKGFRSGKMVGIFTLKLIEPNPIKKVLYFTGTSLNLSYTSPKETEIFYGNGTKDIVKGNASLSGKILANRVVSGYAFEGRNLLRNSDFKDVSANVFGSGIVTNNAYLGGNSFKVIAPSDNYQEMWVPNYLNYETNTDYTLSFFARGSELSLIALINGGTEVNILPLTNGWIKYVWTFKVLHSPTHLFVFRVQRNKTAEILQPKLEKGNVATDHTLAPEDQKFIIIAGNTNELTNLTTNAEVLWERL